MKNWKNFELRKWMCVIVCEVAEIYRVYVMKILCWLCWIIGVYDGLKLCWEDFRFKKWIVCVMYEVAEIRACNLDDDFVILLLESVLSMIWWIIWLVWGKENEENLCMLERFVLTELFCEKVGYVVSFKIVAW